LTRAVYTDARRNGRAFMHRLPFAASDRAVTRNSLGGNGTTIVTRRTAPITFVGSYYGEAIGSPFGT